MPKVPRPEPLEFDVFVCCREPDGSAIASRLADGLSQRRFRVFHEDRGPASERGADPRRLRLIEESPDFVLVLTPGLFDDPAGTDDPVRAELAHALATARNVVVMAAPGAAHPRAESLPDDLRALADAHRLAFAPDRETESIALLWHRLSSQASLTDRREMKGAKRWFVAAGVFILAIAAIEVARQVPKWLERPPDTRPLAPMSVYWAGVGQRLDGGRWAGFPLTDGAAVRPGDRLKLAFSPSADGYAYVVSHDLTGEVAMLYPGSALKLASRVRAGTIYEAPVETRWLTVEPETGVASLHLVVSYDPIQNLEELLEATGGQPEGETRRSLADSTLAGLLDGRHGVIGRTARTRDGRPIREAIAPAPGPKAAEVTLPSGATVSLPLAAQAGRLSTTVEIRLRQDASPHQ